MVVFIYPIAGICQQNNILVLPEELMESGKNIVPYWPLTSESSDSFFFL